MQYVSVIGGLLIDLLGSPAASLAAVSSLIGAPPPPIGQSRGFPPPHQSLELLLLLIHFVMPWDHLSSLPPKYFHKIFAPYCKTRGQRRYSFKGGDAQRLDCNQLAAHGLKILQSLPCTLYSTFSVNSTEHLVIATDLRESSSTKLHRLRLSV